MSNLPKKTETEPDSFSPTQLSELVGKGYITALFIKDGMLGKVLSKVLDLPLNEVEGLSFGEHTFKTPQGEVTVVNNTISPAPTLEDHQRLQSAVARLPLRCSREGTTFLVLQNYTRSKNQKDPNDLLDIRTTPVKSLFIPHRAFFITEAGDECIMIRNIAFASNSCRFPVAL